MKWITTDNRVASNTGFNEKNAVVIHDYAGNAAYEAQKEPQVPMAQADALLLVLVIQHSLTHELSRSESRSEFAHLGSQAVPGAMSSTT